MKKISIIIPTYNRAQIISRSIESILKQTFQDWECIVVDDHSQDNTKDVIDEYIAKDNRIKYIVNTQKKGAQGARNTGLLNAESDWVFFFDSDNTLEPDFLKVLCENIDDRFDVIQCFSRVIDVNSGATGEAMHWISNGNIHNELFNGKTYVDFNHAIIRKSKVFEIGMLDENCPSMQEWDTHIRLSKISRYKTIERVLVNYYVGAKDAISSDTKREVNGRMYILSKHLDEWRSRKVALIKYCYLIIYLIKKNTDVNFKKQAYAQLCALEKYAPIYYRIGCIRSTIVKLLRKLTK